MSEKQECKITAHLLSSKFSLDFEIKIRVAEGGVS